ncbi:hypothetical protein BZA77DRAFT_348008 [Pyronema omphalodes]|nr:hypothetical protein BZA77DRAFT_348008 [Pyronema omphalodes]
MPLQEEDFFADDPLDDLDADQLDFLEHGGYPTQQSLHGGGVSNAATAGTSMAATVATNSPTIATDFETNYPDGEFEKPTLPISNRPQVRPTARYGPSTATLGRSTYNPTVIGTRPTYTNRTAAFAAAATETAGNKVFSQNRDLDTDDWVDPMQGIEPAPPQAAVTAPYQNFSTGRSASVPNAATTMMDAGINAELAAARRRIAELEALAKKKEQEALAKSGEIANVRNKLDTVSREWERKMAQNMQSFGEEKEKLLKEVEVFKETTERAKTELAFVMKERDEIVRREKISRSTGWEDKKKDVIVGSPTPKRSERSLAMRDGFDEDVVMLNMSPSRKMSRTPSKGKRKRSINGSPIPQLQLGQLRSNSHNLEQPTFIDERVLENLFSADDRLEFFEAIILHRFPTTQERIFDALTRHSFPSSPNVTLSSTFLDNATHLRLTSDPGTFPLSVSRFILSLWSRCLNESYYAPLSLLIELLRFGLLWAQGAHSFHIMDSTLSLIQATVDIDAIPRCAKPITSNNNNNNNHSTTNPTPEIPTLLCLQLMHDIALNSLSEEVQIKRFWKQIRLDFPPICLHPWQATETIRMMASILSTSVLRDTYGPIMSSSQQENEELLLEAITKPLEMSPRAEKNPLKIISMRLQILIFLSRIACIETGKLRLVTHSSVLNRVVNRAAEEVDEAYEWRLGEAEKRLQIVNVAVKLVNAVILSYPEKANERLRNNQNLLVLMARVAFSEGKAQEFGLLEETIDVAFQLLNDMVSPDEAAMLESMFNA